MDVVFLDFPLLQPPFQQIDEIRGGAKWTIKQEENWLGSQGSEESLMILYRHQYYLLMTWIMGYDAPSASMSTI